MSAYPKGGFVKSWIRSPLNDLYSGKEFFLTKLPVVMRGAFLFQGKTEGFYNLIHWFQPHRKSEQLSCKACLFQH